MGAWIGLAGVIAGALVAFVSQYVLRGAETRDRRDSLVLEQLATLIAMSEDFRNRVWEERHKVASGVVADWDIRTHRLAEARLQLLCTDDGLLSALGSLPATGQELGRTWRSSPEDEARVQSAWEAHRTAMSQFITAGSRAFTRRDNQRAWQDSNL